MISLGVSLPLLTLDGCQVAIGAGQPLAAVGGVREARAEVVVACAAQVRGIGGAELRAVWIVAVDTGQACLAVLARLPLK